MLSEFMNFKIFYLEKIIVDNLQVWTYNLRVCIWNIVGDDVTPQQGNEKVEGSIGCHISHLVDIWLDVS